jgi:hypothetical protein
MPSKSRDLSVKLYGGKLYEKGGKVSSDLSEKFRLGKGIQITESEGHPRDQKTGRYLEGGPFYTVRSEYSVPTVSGTVHNWTGKYYTGKFYTVLPGSPESAVNIESIRSRKDFSDLDKKGATAISISAPTNSNAELGTSLAEILREKRVASIPGIIGWKERTNIARAAASEYLNVEFGWKPLVSDIHDTMDSVRHSRDIVQQYQRDEGRTVRREFSFPVERTSLEVKGGETQPQSGQGTPLAPEGTNGYLVTSIESEVRKWFVGAFTYTLPSRGSSWQGIYEHGSNADKLFGTALDPDVLWELAPWSWAVYWVSNTGDVIHNINNLILGGLVMRYGYMMEEKTIKTTNRIVGASYSDTFLNSVPPSTLIQVSKVRRPANPFGFGLTWEGLSPTQLAIAAACGITHL